MFIWTSPFWLNVYEHPLIGQFVGLGVHPSISSAKVASDWELGYEPDTKLIARIRVRGKVWPRCQ